MLKIYNVAKIYDDSLRITNKDSKNLWDKATTLTAFLSPWSHQPIALTSFQSLWDSKTLFFRFKVYDSDIYIDTKDNTKSNINNSDRVELFFRSNKSMNPYYCLEIDPSPRIMDFKAFPNKKFDFDWNWPSNDLKVTSSIKNTQYTVEGEVSLQSLNKLGLIKKGQIEIGIFRAKYKKQDHGGYEPTWITWIDPKTPFPNFHIASAFGVLQLEDFPQFIE